MKLHLPVTLLRAVMALFASQVALTSAWAEETEATNPTTITHAVTDNTVYLYGSGDENWQNAWREEWSADEIIITSGDQKKHDVTFKFEGADIANDCVMEASKLTISNLGGVTIDGFQGSSFFAAIIDAVEYNIINNDSFNYINNNGVVFTEPGNDYSIMRFVNNGEINITGNSAYLEGHFTLGAAIEDIKDVLITGTKRDITMSYNKVESGQEWVSGSAVRLEGKLTFAGNQGNIVVSHNTGRIMSGHSGDAHGGAILAFGVEITGTGGDISFNDNAVYTEGRDYAGGGAISSTGAEDIEVDGVLVGVKLLGNITLSDNLGNIEFNRNKVQSGSKDAYDTDMIQVAAGGAMVAQGKVEISGNKGNLIGFNSNRVEAEYNSAGGGAIAVIGALEIAENKADVEALTAEDENAGNKLEFKNNSVSSLSDSVCGGAIYSSNDELISAAQDRLGIDYATAEILVDQLVPTYVSIDNNGDVSFIDNSITSGEVDADGKAVRHGDFADGGAIYSEGEVSLSNNADVEFSGNNATSVGSSVRGGAVYSEASVDISGNAAVTFDSNVAKSLQIKSEYGDYYNSGSAYGGAIYSEGDVELSHNGAVSFGGVILDEDGETVGYENGNIVQGKAAHGGAVYSKGDVTLSNNSSVSFYDNALEPTEGDAFGGAIYSAKSVSIENNTNGVNFSGNSITCNEDDDGFGGAIYAGLNSGSSYANADFGHNVKLSGNGNVTFADNKIVSEFRARGGAIYADGHITLSGNGDVTFSGNSVISDDGGSAIGGAISTYLVKSGDNKEEVYKEIPVSVTLSGNSGNIKFSGNSATAKLATTNGGAIYSAGQINITGNQGNITFSENAATAESAYAACGGALAGLNGVNIIGNGVDGGEIETIEFSGNTVTSNGGFAGAAGVYSFCGDVVISENNADIKFSDNIVNSIGRYDVVNGDGTMHIEDFSKVIVAGGAIGTDQSSVSITGNKGNVTFTGNAAIDIDGTEPIPVEKFDDANDDSVFSQTGGGAIMAMQNVNIDSNEGDVTITGNYASSDSRLTTGGAIAALGTVSISHNKGDVNVTGNYVSTKSPNSVDEVAVGGAIFAGNGLSIVNNEGNVTFSGNYMKNANNYQLNSVYVKSGNVELAAAEGKSILFNDSFIVADGGNSVKLNSYTDTEGNMQTTTGTIVFSGANAVETLQQLKGEGGTVSAGEISASLTSQINREVSVAGGSLQVKDGAVLRMQSLVVNNGADLLIGAGSTVAVGSTVTFEAGSEYTVLGLKAATTMTLGEVASSTPTAQIDGNIVLTAGMTYTMDGAYTELVGSANELAFKGSGTYTFNVDESVAYTEGTTKYFVLFTGVDTLTGAELSTGVDPTLLSGIEFLTNIGYYDDIMLHYLNHETAGGVLYISATVPEPTTATLSLLALAALAARRRRK